VQIALRKENSEENIREKQGAKGQKCRNCNGQLGGKAEENMQII
jgi:hypothetical protein